MHHYVPLKRELVWIGYIWFYPPKKFISALTDLEHIFTGCCKAYGTAAKKHSSAFFWSPGKLQKWKTPSLFYYNSGKRVQHETDSLGMEQWPKSSGQSNSGGLWLRVITTLLLKLHTEKGTAIDLGVEWNSHDWKAWSNSIKRHLGLCVGIQVHAHYSGWQIIQKTLPKLFTISLWITQLRNKTRPPPTTEPYQSLLKPHFVY